MSRSNKDDVLENPAKRFFDWKGGDGTLTYYDKEKKEDVVVDRPFRFLVLDEVATVGGGVDNGSGYVGFWSNAIRPRDAKVSEFTVRSSHNGQSRVEFTGIWSDVKAHLTGAKYIKGLYIGYFEGNELALGYLKVRGAALSPWMELTKIHKDIYAGAFQITKDVTEQKKGTNKYFEPVIEHIPVVKDETNEAAEALDRDVLQPYLTAYFGRKPEAAAATNGAPTHTGQDEYAPNLDAEPVNEPDEYDPIPF